MWESGQLLKVDGLYRPGDLAWHLFVEGPGKYHPDAGQPIPFRIGLPFDIGDFIDDCDEYDFFDVDPYFEHPLPDGSGVITGGGAAEMGNIGWLARLDPDRSLRWAASMFYSNPFTGVRFEGMTAIITNDWRNILTLDLMKFSLR